MNKDYLDYLCNTTNISSKLIGMELFLNHILKLMKENYDANKKISTVNEHIIRSELIRSGFTDADDYILEGPLISSLDIKKRGYFDAWQQKFANVPNILVYCNEARYPYFMQFKNGHLEPDEPFTKIYLSLDSKHLFEGANRLFMFIAQNNIEHASKIGGCIRSDSIIIRIRQNDRGGLNQIINFINKDSYIQEGLNKMSPFIPSNNNVAAIPDYGESYNAELSKLIRIVALKNIDKDYLSVDDLLSEIDLVMNDNVRGILYNHITYEKENGKSDVLAAAVSCTYEQIGYKQATEAIKQVIKNNNYRYFSRFKGQDKSINYRNLLSSNLRPNQIVDTISDYLSRYGYKTEMYSIPDLIELYVLQITAEQQRQIIEESMRVMTNSQGSYTAEYILNNFIKTGNSANFANNTSEINYQQLMDKKVNPKYVLPLIKYSLNRQGIDTSHIYPEEMLKTYIDGLQTDVFVK